MKLFSIAAAAFPGDALGLAVGSRKDAVTDANGDPNRQLARGGSDLVLLSRNGGGTWSDRSLPGLPPLNLLSCADAQNCLAADTGSRILVRYGPPN
ncbi:MAG: hypothetical protein M0031_08630 [Thermaerobacter sp.]|nr:hypothetical protein [Thermaerobacter sp.]